MNGKGVAEGAGPAVRTWADLQVGDQAAFEVTIDGAAIDAFAALSGDVNPLHMDPAVGRRRGFGGRVVHGLLLASYCSRLVGMYLPGRDALYLSQSCRFLKVVREGETVRVVGTVTAKSEAARGITLRTEIFNAQGTRVLDGEAQVLVQEPLTEKKSPEPAPVTLDLSGKTALVTGASRGIGASTALLLARHGAAVAVNYRTQEEAAKDLAARIQAGAGRALAVQADVRDAAAVARMVETVKETLGPVDILVNNASGELFPQSFRETQWEDFRRHLEVTLQGAYHCIRAVTEGMVARGYGKVINVVTASTLGVPPDKLSAYITAKYGLLGLSKALAAELGPLGIRVNMVSPGLTETDLVSHVPGRIKDVYAHQTPLRRLAQVEDVARTILFLASEASDFITGADIPICGGYVM